MLCIYENGKNIKNQLKKETQFKIQAQVTKQDNVRNSGTFPHSIDHSFMCLFVCLCVCICVSICTPVCLHLPEESIKYPLLLSAYFFEAVSLPGPRASVFSARPEARKPQPFCLWYLWWWGWWHIPGLFYGPCVLKYSFCDCSLVLLTTELSLQLLLYF